MGRKLFVATLFIVAFLLLFMAIALIWYNQGRPAVYFLITGLVCLVSGIWAYLHLDL